MTKDRFALAALVLAALVAVAPGAFAARETLSSYAAAQAAVAKGDYQTAIISLRNAIQENPNDASLRLQLCDIYLKVENYIAAEATARFAQQAGASEDQVDPRLAIAMVLQYRYTALIATLETGSRTPAAEATVRTALAIAHIMRGDLDIGERLLADADRLDPDTPLLPLALTRLKMARGDLPGAEAQIAEAKAGPIGSAAPEHVTRLESEILRLKGDDDGAMVILNNLLTKDPDDLPALVAHADILIERGDLDGAQKDVDHALDLAPGSLTPSYLSALLLTRHGDYKAADEILTAISEYFVALPNGYYLQGLVKFQLGQHAIAVDALGHYLGRRPNDPAAIRLLATIAISDHNYYRAIELLQPAIDADPADSVAVDMLAQTYIALGRPDAAVDLYQKAAAADPDNTKRQAAAALMRMRYGNSVAGFASLERLAMTAKGVDVAGPIVVLRHLHDGDVQQAAAVAQNLIEHGKDNLVAQNVLGMVRLAQFRIDDALPIFQGIVAADPTFIDAQRNLARTYLALNRLDDAKHVYETVLAQRPKDLATLYALADLAEAAGDLDAAAQRLGQARTVAPADRNPAMRLVSLYARHKDWDRAIQAAKDLVTAFPRDPPAIDMLASARGETGDKAGAANEYYALTQFYPRSPQILRRYADFQLKAGDHDGARASLDRAMLLAPDDFGLMHDAVAFDYAARGVDAALATARAFHPSHPAASDLLVAQVLDLAQRRDEAIDTLTRGQDQHPAADNAIELAELLFGAGKHDAAEQLLAAWIDKHNDALAVQLALANLYLMQHDDDKAQAVYETMLPRVPNNVVVVNNLASIYARKHDPRANDLAQKAFRLVPGGATADTLGWTLLGAGDAAAGLPFLKNAAGTLPQDMSVQYHLAVALAATGDTASARTLLERVVGSKAAFAGKDDAKRRLADLGSN